MVQGAVGAEARRPNCLHAARSVLALEASAPAHTTQWCSSRGPLAAVFLSGRRRRVRWDCSKPFAWTDDLGNEISVCDTPHHFLSPDIELIAGLHIGRQIAQHKEAAEARAMATAQAEQDCLAALAKAGEPALMDVLHTFVVSTHNEKHDAEVRKEYETVHVPERPQPDCGGYPRAPLPASTYTKATRSGYYLPVILADSQMLPSRIAVFSDGNDAFRRYRARSAQYQHHSSYEYLAVLNKHKLTDDDYKTGVLTQLN